MPLRPRTSPFQSNAPAFTFAVAIAFLCCALGPARAAGAAPVKGGVDPQGTLSGDGSTVTVSGTVDCSQSNGNPVSLRVTITQTATAIVAEGGWQQTCTATNQAWSVQLTSSGGGATLAAGSVDVAVLDYTDAVQWIGTTTLAQGS